MLRMQYRLLPIAKHLCTRTITANFGASTAQMSCTESKLHLLDGNFIAYAKRTGDPHKPGLMFCSGFLSSLNGTKAKFLDEYARKNCLSCVRFDYVGHPQSSGTMDDFTVSLWKQNTLDVLDQLTTGPQILVGSSMGGWTSLLAAIERPQRVHSLITIAVAADSIIQRFDNPIFNNPEFTHKKREEYGTGDDKYADGSPYWVERLEDARLNSVFAHDPIPISCPMRLLHGMNDVVIPYQNSVKVAEKVKTEDVVVSLSKKSDHRMSEEHDLNTLTQFLDELVTL